MLNFIHALTHDILSTKQINKNYLIIYKITIIFHLITKTILYKILQLQH